MHELETGMLKQCSVEYIHLVWYDFQTFCVLNSSMNDFSDTTLVGRQTVFTGIPLLGQKLTNRHRTTDIKTMTPFKVFI